MQINDYIKSVGTWSRCKKTVIILTVLFITAFLIIVPIYILNLPKPEPDEKFYSNLYRQISADSE